MNNKFDVVIVGAGLGGLQCARLLGKRGASVLLVDRKSSLDESVHTTGIFVRRTIEDYSFPSKCLGPPVRHVRLYSPQLRSIDFESPFEEFRVGKMGRLYLSFLEDCISSGVGWMPNTSFTGSRAAGGGSTITLETMGEKLEVFARILIGADGARSRVARDLELDSNKEWIVGVEDVYSGVPLEGPPRLHCFLDPRLAPGYIAWAVNDGEEVHLGVGGYAAKFEPLRALAELRVIVSNRLFNLDHAVQVERRSGRIPVGGVLPLIANRRGLLIGDAAGAVSPLTAGGLDPCMRLSEFAANAVGAFLQSSDRRSLDAYSGREFRRHFQKRLWMRGVIKHIEQPSILEFGCRLLGLSPFKSIAWNIFFGRGSFPETSGNQAKTPSGIGSAPPAIVGRS